MTLTSAFTTHAAQPTETQITYDHIERMMHAVEGECDGLAIDAGQAMAILAHVFGPHDHAALSQPPKAPGEVAELRNYCRILLANLDYMAELTGESVEDEDAIIVNEIRSALVSAPTSEPGTRGPTLAETDAANAEAGARAIQAIIGEPDTQALIPAPSDCDDLHPFLAGVVSGARQSTAPQVDAGEVIEALRKLVETVKTHKRGILHSLSRRETDELMNAMHAANVALSALHTPPATDGTEDGR